MLRNCLYAAGHSIFELCEKNQSLEGVGKRIEARSGKKKAKVALARKLAVIMHRMLESGEEFRAAAAATAPVAA